MGKGNCPGERDMEGGFLPRVDVNKEVCPSKVSSVRLFGWVWVEGQFSQRRERGLRVLVIFLAQCWN